MVGGVVEKKIEILREITTKQIEQKVVLMKVFRALVVEEKDSGVYSRSIKEREVGDLQKGEVLIKVQWSSLNYKDALSATGNKGVTRKFPHTPGIDASGVVEESKSDLFGPGAKVIVTSYDLGMNTPGGFAEYIVVPEAWVVALPSGLTLKESMEFGTAGLTAALSVSALTRTVMPDNGEILVTGATGGVGSLSVAILSKLGYAVVAVSGKPEASEFLLRLGAKRILSRGEACKGADRPMLKTCWAGVIDTVGGDILTAAIKSANMMGVVTCCGNVASPDLPLNVFPFILRGISLVGIDSQNCSMEYRKEMWGNLAGAWKPVQLEELCRSVSLEELDLEIDVILRGGQKGRVLVKL